MRRTTGLQLDTTQRMMDRPRQKKEAWLLSDGKKLTLGQVCFTALGIYVFTDTLNETRGCLSVDNRVRV